MSTHEESKKWAQGIVDAVNNDPRKFVKCKESRPITDLKDMLVSSVELYGDKVAYLQKNDPKGKFEEITYNQTFEDVKGLGTALLANGMQGKRIAVIGDNSYQWCISYLATVCGVGVVVPLDKELSINEIRNQIIRAEVACALFDEKRRETFEEIYDEGGTPLKLLVNFNSEEKEGNVESFKELITQGQQMMANGNDEFMNAQVDNEGMGILLFTSGTTGIAKGVMLSHKNICTKLMVAPTIFCLTPEDRYLSILPLHHTYESTCCFLMGLYKGCSVAFCQGLKYITKNMEEVKPTMMLGVPVLYDKLYTSIWKNVKKQGKTEKLKRAISINNALKKIKIDFSHKFFKQIYDVFGGRIKTLICGGSAINPAILDGLRDFGINALQGYGLTECAPMGAFNPEDAPKSKSVGVPFPGLEVKVIDKNEEGIGEVCVRGDHVMLGYYEMPDETAEVLDDERWFHTGDMGYIDKQGYVYLSGRKKNVIVTSNGKNVYPEEIEYQLSKIDFVVESYVFEGETANTKDTMIVASVRVDEDEVKKYLGDEYTDFDVKDLIWQGVDRINDEAPFYRRIKKVIYRKKDFVKNTSQKLIRFDPDNKLDE